MPGSTSVRSGIHWLCTRGAATAVAMFMSNTMALRSVCSTVVMISEPPGLPAASQGCPSLKTMVGVIEESGRLPGAIVFASPCTSP